jgi:hypothetical protein
MNNSYFEDLEKRVDSEAEAEVQGLEAQFRAGKARNNLEGLQDNPPLNSSSLGIRHFRFLCFFFSSHFTVKNSGHFRERPSSKLYITLPLLHFTYMAFCQTHTIPA